MQDRSDRYQFPAVPSPPFSSLPKRIGSYLIEAGLLTADQISVILNDQQATGMRFGEIAVARGWLKEQTIEWIVAKVVEPERQASQQPQPQTPLSHSSPLRQRLQSVPKRSHTKPAISTADPSPMAPPAASVPASNSAAGNKAYVRRDIPISKPLPSVNSSDNDVNWVG